MSISTIDVRQVPYNDQNVYVTSVKRENNTEENKGEDISIGKALETVVSSVANGALSMVGYTGSTLYHLPKAFVEVAETVIKNKLIGPNLKTLLLGLLPLVTVTVPPLVAVGSLIYGIFSAFDKSLDNNESMKEILKNEVQNIKEFNNNHVKKFFDLLDELEKEKLPEGSKPIDIRIIETVKGLIGAAAGIAIDSVGAAAITAINLPSIIKSLAKEIMRETENAPVKRSLSFLLLAIISVLAVPGATVGGAFYGLYNGAKEGYKNGIIESISSNFNDLKEYNNFLRKNFLKKI